MANKPRSPMQLSPVFEIKIKDLQKKIMKKHGENISLRDLSEKIAKDPNFEALEQALLNLGDFDIRINFDKRRR